MKTREIKLALAVVTGRLTLDQVRRRFRSAAKYYEWYIAYYTPIAEAKKKLDAALSLGVAVAIGAQAMTSAIQTIMVTTQKEMANWTKEDAQEFATERYEWTFPELNKLQKPAIIKVFKIIDKYVDMTYFDYKNRPSVDASVNQLRQAEMALLKYDKLNSGKKILAVLLGTLKLEDF